VNLLLIHQNFPGQFRQLVGAWIASGHSVVALGERPLSIPTEAFTYLAYGSILPPQQRFPEGPLDEAIELALRRGWRVAEACRDLRQQGYIPDALVVHSSWGEALHVREIWPKAVLLAYPEIYGSRACMGMDLDPDHEPINDGLVAAIERRNMLALAAIQVADAAVVPTAFQRSTFPLAVQERLHVIHEGVNTELVAPNPASAVEVGDGLVLRPGDPVVTFASRHLEPLRGFSQLIKALPALLHAHPNVQVLIAGHLHGQGYGPASTHPGGHAAALLDAYGSRIDWQRVHLLGALPYPDLLALFQVSAVHVHLTYPYTLSWSVLEAMACGAAVVGSASAPLTDLIHHEHNGLLVPFQDEGALAAAILRLLLDRRRRDRLAQAARSTVEHLFGLERCSTAYLQLITQLRESR